MQVSLACCQIAHVVLPHGPPKQPRWWYLPATKAPLVTSDETTLQTSNQANLESNNIRYSTYIIFFSLSRIIRPTKIFAQFIRSG